MQSGTMFFMPPEIAEDAFKKTPQVDVWALGLVFMQVILGNPLDDFARLFAATAAALHLEQQCVLPFALFLRVHEEAFVLVLKKLLPEPSTASVICRMLSGANKRPNASQLLDDPVIMSWRFFCGKPGVKQEVVIKYLSANDESVHVLAAGLLMPDIKIVKVLRCLFISHTADVRSTLGSARSVAACPHDRVPYRVQRCRQLHGAAS
jgi:serine/threonine protein kinase